MSPEELESSSHPSDPTNDKRVGVTIITGFLGSGKSTLIRRILTEDHGMRLVVVENEFGANTAVEEAIVTQGVGPSALEHFIELPNGCICCAAQDDLTDALSRLLRTPGTKVDHILVEASGLADPGPIAASFWVDEELETGLQLDAVLAIADAVNLESYLADGRGRSEKATITQKQLAVADLILLNKVDLVGGADGDSTESNVRRLRRVIRDAGSTSRVIATTQCNVNLSQLFNISAYDNKASEMQLIGKVPQKFTQHVHPERMAIGSLSFDIEGAIFDAALLDRALGQLLWEDADAETATHSEAAGSTEIWRMKALVVINGEKYKRIYQSVHTLFDHSPSSVEITSETNYVSRFIFIGKLLEENKLRSCITRANFKAHGEMEG